VTPLSGIKAWGYSSCRVNIVISSNLKPFSKQQRVSAASLLEMRWTQEKYQGKPGTRFVLFLFDESNLHKIPGGFSSAPEWKTQSNLKVSDILSKLNGSGYLPHSEFQWRNCGSVAVRFIESRDVQRRVW
jgi:hypothetical protein